MLPKSFVPILLMSTVHLSSCYSASRHCRRTDINDDRRGIKAVLSVDFPDPSVIEVDGVWFAFATSDGNRNIQVAACSDFINHRWVLLSRTDVLPSAGTWAVNNNVWAPDVMQLDDESFIMYYAAPVVGNSSMHCVGAATSRSILGPYNPTDRPLACPLSEGGAIDPAGFLDPKTNKTYITYKVDGNSLNTGDGPCNGPGPDGYHATPIRLQEVSRQDGLTLIGGSIDILDRDSHDGPLVEAPSLFYSQQHQLYFLTFSSNCYCTDQYDISFAYSFSLKTKFNKSSYPLMTTSMGLVRAPGGADMTPDGRFALFHGTVVNNGSGLVRYLYAAEADISGLDLAVAIVL